MVVLLIDLVTSVVVVWQPHRLGVGWRAMMGTALVLLLGVVHLLLGDALHNFVDGFVIAAAFQISFSLVAEA